MRSILISMLVLSGQPLPAQDTTGQRFFETTGSSNRYHYYVGLRETDARVYRIGIHYHKAGTGASIISTDTLEKNVDGTYAGAGKKITSKDGKLYLKDSLTKKQPFPLAARSLPAAWTKLNNAYYLDSYYRMTGELNAAYPTDPHSISNAFFSWDALPYKDMDYREFRKFTDQRLKVVKDSIGQVMTGSAALMNYIIANIGTMEYATLKDSLAKFPRNRYYNASVKAIAKQRPAYFFRLAEDFPADRLSMFILLDRDKQVFKGLYAVEGYDDLKKELRRARRIWP